MSDLTRAQEIILAILTDEALAAAGVHNLTLRNVATNVAPRDLENSLTYLLGVQDCAFACGNRQLGELIHDCRSALKAEFRDPQYYGSEENQAAVRKKYREKYGYDQVPDPDHAV